MEDKKAAMEARKKKLRALEQSLFGNDSSGVVGLPEVKDVGEYEQKARGFATLRPRTGARDGMLESFGEIREDSFKKQVKFDRLENLSGSSKVMILLVIYYSTLVSPITVHKKMRCHPF